MSTKKDKDIANAYDALDLTLLSESELMRQISERYLKQRIYTFVGPTIIIAMNPFRDFKGAPEIFEQMYGAKNQARYKPNDSPKNEPHVYSIGANAVRQLTAHRRSQSILITGESGSGKTESTKKLLKYFADQDGAMSGITQSTNVEGSFEMKLSNMNFILEAFGNAVTSRNHNSSRFGKWIELVYDRNRNLRHAQIKTYVLETSRVIHHNQAERNYHIFYRLFNNKVADHSSSLRDLISDFKKICKGLGIDPLETPYVKAHKVGKATEWEHNEMKKKLVKSDDDEEGAEMVKSFTRYGFSEDQISHIYKTVLAVILLGSINFELDSDGSSGKLTKESAALVPHIAEYIGFSEENLVDYFTKIHLVKEDFPAQKGKCEASVVTLAKTLYETLFGWIVAFLNNTLTQGQKQEENDRFVGLLDIAGFEHFEVNGLDQLLINYNNENLQNAFNTEFIQKEMDTYESEGVLTLADDFRKRFASKDNKIIIDLIRGSLQPKTQGILSVLVEIMKAPGKDEEKDDKFVKNLLQKKAIVDHVKFEKPKFGNETFSIIHYADKVTYGVQDGWIEKIKLSITKIMERAVTNSTNPHLKEMFTGVTSDTKQTLVDVYLKDIGHLMDEIDKTDRQYVRCIKPNKTMTYKDGVDKEETRLQLACSGVMEAVEIRVQGYGYREAYREIVITFAEILTDEKKKLKRGEKTLGEQLKEKYKADKNALPISEAKQIIENTKKLVRKDPDLLKLVDDANMGFGKTLLFCRVDPREALHKALDCNLKARCERTCFAIRLTSAWIYYKTREERIRKERSERIYNDCLQWKAASDKAQKRVPDIPGGLFLYPKPIIGGVASGSALCKSAAMFNTLIKALEKLDVPEQVAHIKSLRKVAKRMIIEGDTVTRAEKWIHMKKDPKKFSITEYHEMYDLISEAKTHQIYNPIFDELNKLTGAVKKINHNDPRLKERNKKSAAKSY